MPGGMARALRIDIAGAWYHGMNRGHRGGALFLDDPDRRRFLGAVAELPERFGLEVHAFVLMNQRRRDGWGTAAVGKRWSCG